MPNHERFTKLGLATLAATIYGEARGESFDGQVAVAHVILNRLKRPKRFADTLEKVCRQKFQFSCWNAGDPNSVACKAIVDRGDSEILFWHEDPVFRKCVIAAYSAVNGTAPDKTGGATHYFVTKSKKPKWVEGKEPSAVIGAHSFYNNID